ncbi:GPW/gp25 family protein [Algicola sagamiensis]|uniref:GPW/gp25 family protein n=1 Tax=Algicola sagamiensis TaxID=163869 RepID=UPI000372FE13|nr:GPW/gp25 family protein [Algicola sagamiensis]
MQGMCIQTGKPLAGIAHLRQSIVDILKTPRGSRVMRRNYGSRLFELVDAPINQETIVEIYASTAEALDTWEPRFQLQNIQVTRVISGRIEMDLMGLYQEKHVTLQGLQL